MVGAAGASFSESAEAHGLWVTGSKWHTPLVVEHNFNPIWLQTAGFQPWFTIFCLGCVASLVAQLVKNLPVMQEPWVQVLGLGRVPGEGNGNSLQYSCLENPTDRGAWRARVHGVARVGHNLTTKSAPPPLLPTLDSFYCSGHLGLVGQFSLSFPYAQAFSWTHRTQLWPRIFRRSLSKYFSVAYVPDIICVL